MDIQFMPQALQGEVAAPVSKSAAHRLLIAAALADLPTRLYCPGSNQDIDATVSCLTALGAKIERDEQGFTVTPLKGRTPPDGIPTLDCGESGSTLRFLLPVAAALGGSIRFVGHGRLPNRPLSPLYEELTAHGAQMSPNGQMPLTVQGGLTAGKFRLAANVSSQFVSGLLFALSLLNEPAEIELVGKIESVHYIEMTLQALAAFGIHPTPTEKGWAFSGNEHYLSPGELQVEGDWSNAAFWLCAAAVGGSPITVNGLSPKSLQGDKAIVPLLRRFGATVTEKGDSYTVSAGTLHGIEVDGSQIPDLIPILAVTAAFAEGVTTFRNIARLRIKESDRVETVKALLAAVGVSSKADENTLTVYGKGKTPSPSAELSSKCCEIDSFNDHRIAMAAAVAASCVSAPILLHGGEAVRKSYPDFYDRFTALGGIIRSKEN